MPSPLKTISNKLIIKPSFFYKIYKGLRKWVLVNRAASMRPTFNDLLCTLHQLVKDEHLMKTENIKANFSKLERFMLQIVLACYKANTKIGSPTQAENWLDRALLFAPLNSTLQRDKGVFHQKRQEWKEACIYFEKACTLRPDIASYHGSLAYSQYQLGNYTGAVEEYYKALAIDGDNRAWWIRLARAQIHLDALLDALESYKKALTLQEDTQIRNIHDELARLISSGSRTVGVAYYDAIFTDSAKYRQAAENSEYAVIWHHIVDILRNNTTQSILDLGCGPGQFAEFITTHMPDVQYTGLDFSTVAISQARQRCPHYLFKQQELSNIIFNELPPFDTVVCTEVLEHVENDLEILSEIPIGSFIVASVPNFDSFGHVRLFHTPQEIQERYGSIIDNMEIHKITLTAQNTLWLLYGRRAGQSIEEINSLSTITPQLNQSNRGASEMGFPETILYPIPTSSTFTNSAQKEEKLFTVKDFFNQNSRPSCEGPLPFEYIQTFYETLLESNMDRFLDFNDLQFSQNQDIKTEEGLNKLFEEEYKLWRKESLSNTNSKKLNLLIQHDSDSGPIETEYMCAFEAAIGIKSTTAIFCRLRSNNSIYRYKINYALLKQLQDEKHMCFAYHCNAAELAAYDEQKIANIFNEDVEFLYSQGLNIQFFSPHGGIPSSSGLNNNSFFYPSFSNRRLVWTHNKFSPKGHRYSDGGGISRNLNMDLRNWFITRLSSNERPLTHRYFLLLHPQYYFAKDSSQAEKYFTSNPWLREFWELYSAGRAVEYWEPLLKCLKSL